MPNIPAPLRLLLGAVMISFSAVFVKLTTVAPTVSAFYRMFWGAWPYWRWSPYSGIVCDSVARRP